MRTVACVGMVIVAKSLSDRLLRRANKEFFAPRGLRVRICKTAAMRQLVGLSAEPKKGKLARAGHVAESIALHCPGIRKVYNRRAAPPPTITVDPAAPSSPAERRVESLEGHALPLDFDVPPFVKPKKIMQRAQAMSMRLELWKERQEEKKAVQHRQLLAIAEGHAVSLPRRPPRDSNRWLKKQRELKRESTLQKKEEKARMAAMDEKKLKHFRDKVMLDERVEHCDTRDLLWIVLLTAEQGQPSDSFSLLAEAELLE